MRPGRPHLRTSVTAFGGVGPPKKPSISSVAVVVRLEGSAHRDAEVFRLLRRELGQPDAERVQVQPGHRLVEVLGQGVDTERVRLGCVCSGGGDCVCSPRGGFVVPWRPPLKSNRCETSFVV